MRSSLVHPLEHRRRRPLERDRAYGPCVRVLTRETMVSTVFPASIGVAMQSNAPRTESPLRRSRRPAVVLRRTTRTVYRARR